MSTRFVLGLVLLLVLAACAGDPAGTDAAEGEEAAGVQAGETPAADPADLGSGLTVVTTVFPLADLARQIAPAAEVVPLTGGGQDPHDLELSPSDRALIESADVVLYMGQIDFQPQVEAAVADATGQVVAVAAIASTASLRGFQAHTHDDDGDHGHDDHADDHGDETDDHGHDDHGHDDHGDETDDHGHDDHGDDDLGDEAVDPHIWFDPWVMSEVAEAIGNAFSNADTANREAYWANALEVHDQLVDLDEEIDDILDDCTHEVAIVSHEAYAYLVEPRDLTQEGISGAGGHGEASPQRLAELTERIAAEGIPAVLTEPVEGRADAEALAAEAGVELLEIDPLEIATEELLETGYPTALRAQAETFAQALGCGG